MKDSPIAPMSSAHQSNLDHVKQDGWMEMMKLDGRLKVGS